jgi:putative Mg2+ transporter-C (MgtC) family protein
MDGEVDNLDVFLRLLAATGVGMAIGLNRDLRGKPTGMRTLGLVSLGAATVALATVTLPLVAGHPDALSRVVQGIVQGVLTGIGFVGAGAVLRNPEAHEVHGLTTAASVWATASLGIACGLASWPVVWMGAVLTLVLLFLGNPVEKLITRHAGNGRTDAERREAGRADDTSTLQREG